MSSPKLPEAVVWIDSLGVPHDARRITEPASDGRCLLVIAREARVLATAHGGARRAGTRLQLVRARQAQVPTAACWHRPAGPS